VRARMDRVRTKGRPGDEARGRSPLQSPSAGTTAGVAGKTAQCHLVLEAGGLTKTFH